MGGFTTRLLGHVTARGALGELARSAAADPHWPQGPDRLETFTGQLEDLGATPATLQNLTDAWGRYASHRATP
ncbi:hypothetical protein ACIQUQ_33220 [Streptomyces sp. NPDC101118]|uniref:hypothetical protein n=1 Tax=Streptomyces sp. NPDC101118 TaxID=3366109 RepID=UPI0037F95548